MSSERNAAAVEGEPLATQVGVAESPDSAKASSPTQPKHSSWLIAATLGIVAALGSVFGLAMRDPGYEGTQVLGIVTVADAASDGALSASRQWAAVAASVPFTTSVANKLNVDNADLRSSLSIVSVDAAPVMTVKVTGHDSARISVAIAEVARELSDAAAKSDKRYPVQPLTDIAVTPAKGLSLGLLLGIGTLVGAAVAATTHRLRQTVRRRSL